MHMERDADPDRRRPPVGSTVRSLAIQFLFLATKGLAARLGRIEADQTHGVASELNGLSVEHHDVSRTDWLSAPHSEISADGSFR